MTERTGQRVRGDATPAAERRLGGRFALGAAAAFLVGVPFTLLLVLVLARNQALARLDQGAADRLHDLLVDDPALATTLRVVGRVTEPWVLRALVLVVAAVLWRRGRRRVTAWLLVTTAAGGVLGVVLKLLVARARPSFTEPVAVAGGYSFPSGHALNSMLVAACLAVLWHPRLRGAARAAAWAATVAFVLLVGVDRVGLGVHFVSDVLAGWAVGLATVLATVASFALWQRQEGIPAASPDRGLDPQEDRP